MVVGVDTYDKLVAKIYEKYPDKADAIEKAFTDNGITPKVTKPNGGEDIVFDSFFCDRIVSSSITYIGGNILSKNVAVTNNAKLTLRGAYSVTINTPFTVNQGSQLEITCSN